MFKATGSTTEQTAAPTSISVKGITRTTNNGKMNSIPNLGTSDCAIEVNATGNVYINGVATTSATVKPTAAGTKVQIIVQNGEAAPYITWLNLKSAK